MKYEEWSVPNSPRIYTFRLEALTPFELGLRIDSDLTCEKLRLKIKQKILDRILKVEKIVFSEKLSGTVHNKQKMLTFNPINDISVTNKRHIFIKLKEKLSIVNNIENFISILTTINNLLPPLYVGITYDQTLNERYRQHRKDMNNVKHSSLGGRLASLNIRWAELGFYAKAISINNINKKELELSEDLFQYLTNPILSLR